MYYFLAYGIVAADTILASHCGGRQATMWLLRVACRRGLLWSLVAQCNERMRMRSYCLEESVLVCCFNYSQR